MTRSALRLCRHLPAVLPHDRPAAALAIAVRTTTYHSLPESAQAPVTLC